MKQKFFKIAKAASKKSTHHIANIGSVIVKRGFVLGIGTNKLKTNPASNSPWRTTHSELDAILDCSREDLEGSDIYIYREDKNGSLACCKPCSYCMELIATAKIKNIYYTDNGKFCKL
jgi:deoxycytidylate deaminase